MRSFNIDSVDVQLFIDFELFLLVFKLHSVDISISGLPPTSHICGSSILFYILYSLCLYFMFYMCSLYGFDMITMILHDLYMTYDI